MKRTCIEQQVNAVSVEHVPQTAVHTETPSCLLRQHNECPPSLTLSSDLHLMEGFLEGQIAVAGSLLECNIFEKLCSWRSG